MKSEIVLIDLARIRSDPSRHSLDPLVLRTSWSPNNRQSAQWGTTSFASHKLSIKPGRARVVRTWASLRIISFFVGFGLAAWLLGVPYNFLKGQPEGVAFMLLFGAVFLGFSWMMFGDEKPFTVDMARGAYFFGSSFEEVSRAHPNGIGRLSSIGAVQIVSKTVYEDGGEEADSQYTSYELNLVLETGKRLTVLDQGDRDSVCDAALMLGDLLGRPVWQAPQG